MRSGSDTRLTLRTPRPLQAGRDTFPTIRATLYSLALSHPAFAAHLMLDYKRIDHRVVDLPVGSQPLMLRARGFREATVPALRIDGRRIQGSTRISRELDRIQPEPPLFPTDLARRAAVEEAERWGERSYQPVPRRIFRWALTKDASLRRALAEDNGMPLPAIGGELGRPLTAYFARIVNADDATVRLDLQKLPSLLDHVDALLTIGTIGEAVPNAADFQIATTTRFFLHVPALRTLAEGRPAAEHAMRFCPSFGKEFSIELPPGWLAG